MTGQHEPLPTPDSELVSALELRIRELPGHRNRWAWDLFDSRDGSWFESMFEFDSPERAQRSGISRLNELRQQAVEAPSVASANTRLVIVSADDAELIGTLRRLLGEGKSIEIIPERRKALAPLAQREPDRRTARVNAAAQARGWWVVPRTRDAAS